MYELREYVFQTPHGNAIRMTYRDGTNDWNTLTAALTEDEYLLPAGLTGTAVDVGGHIGSVGIALALDNPELDVIIVEPVSPNIDLIRRNVEANDVGRRVTLLIGAVGRHGEQVSIAYAYRGSESALHHAFIGNALLVNDRDAPHDVVTYPAITLDTLVGAAGGEVAYLKVDTEGAEYDFLDSSAVSKVQTIAGEWHPVGGKGIPDILGLLDRTHVVSFTGPQTGPGGFRAERR